MQSARQKSSKLTEPLRAEIVKIVDEQVRKAQIKELRGLRDAIEKLTEAQRRTEERLKSFEITTEENFKRVWKSIDELTQAQKKAEERLTRLEEVVDELAQAQKRTEEKLIELAEAQKKTEEKVADLADDLKRLRREFGGLSLSMSYAFENESFRILPRFLKERYGLEFTERFIRVEIGGKEINIFGKARRNGKEIYIVGESKLRLDERRDSIEDIIEEINEKVEAVKKEFGDVEVLKLLLTHYTTRGAKREMEKNGIIVVQSFEM